jgi:hypothetical protein
MSRSVLILCAALTFAATWVGCAADPPKSSSSGGAAGSALGGTSGQAGAGGAAGSGSVTFDIRSDTSVHPISPLIYGLNSAAEIATTRQTVVRLGGNRWTAYNWENNASNAGADWHYQNDDYLVLGMANPDAPGEAVSGALQTSHANGAAALLTVPNVDYVSADKNGDGDVRNSGADYLQTRFKLNQAKKGSAFSLAPDPSDATVYQDEFVNWVKSNFSDGPVLFDLDNEPDLWGGPIANNPTHPEVHPDAVTYAELVERNGRFAGAIKDTWPEAGVLGFVSYGWNGFITLQDAPDAKANGDFINYYLDSMSAQSATAGARLIDYLDLHWYPEATDQAGTRITGADITPAEVEARVQAPRSLWDPNYTETSWITQWSSNGPIRLIPRMKEKIAAHYPGTALAISEWNYGGETDISGALATADVLGIFGREDVGLGCNYPTVANESFTWAAFRAYRNFDGAGGQFGDTSIQATTSDVEASSVYASLDSTAPDRMVMVAINKRTYPLVATIQVTHTTSYSQADVFTLTASGPTLTAAPGLSASAANQFLYTMPAQSVSVIVPRP